LKVSKFAASLARQGCKRATILQQSCYKQFRTKLLQALFKTLVHQHPICAGKRFLLSAVGFEVRIFRFVCCPSFFPL